MADQESEGPDYVEDQYASQDGLQVRVETHRRYTRPRVDFVAWVMEQASWRGDERVIDVGAGTGQYGQLARDRCAMYVAADLYMGMLRDLAGSGLTRLNLDAAALPLADDSVDVLLANHMLYYVADVERAAASFARVLRPGGVLLAATNSEQYMGELRALHRRVATRFGYADKLSLLLEAQGFTLENGRRPLAAHFQRVERRDFASELVFTEARPVIDYLASSGKRLFDLLPAGVSWDEVAAALKRELDEHIADHGVFRVSKLAGVFVCGNKNEG
jgi:ubiquinone/menaquinone biosynthesis C-methylase UbiE